MRNLTWKQFKEIVESNGVTDDMEIEYIDVGTDYDDEMDIFIDGKTFSVY